MQILFRDQMERQPSPKVEVSYFSHAGGKRTACRSSGPFSPWVRWCPSECAVWCPMCYQVFLLWLGDIIHSYHPWALVAVPQEAFSRGSGSFFSLSADRNSAGVSKGTPYRSECFFSLLLGIRLFFPGSPRILVLFSLGTLPGSSWMPALWAVA